MGKRLMTLSDLYNYYSAQGKNQRFSCQDDGDTIVVQVDGRLNFSKKNDDTEGLFPVDLQLCFVGDNLNNSRITKESMKNALASAKYRPILGYIYNDENDEPQFMSHNMHMENGDLVYDEIPIGVISEEATLGYDKEYDKDYAFSKGYIFEEYTQAKKILERDEKCDVSVELAIRELSYDSKDKILNLENFYFTGVTILGFDEDSGEKINPAMPGSKVTLADFSAKNNSIVYSDKLIQTLESLNETLSKFEIKSMKGGNELAMFETLLKKYEKSVEDITFEYDGLSDEELELAFAEAFEEPKKKVEDDDAPAEEPKTEDNKTPDVDGDEDDNEESKSLDDEKEPNDNEDDSDNAEDDVDPELNSLQYSISVGDIKKEFSVSLNAQIEALSMLVNDTYADDMTWYSVEVFDKNLVMYDCWSGRAYRQDYKVKNDVYSLKGDRVAVHSMWVTDDEQKAFDEMKSNYSSISDKLAKYEAEPEKIDVLESEEYSSITDKEEFVELKKQENHFDLTVDEIKAKADDIIVKYAKAGQLTFSKTDSKVTSKNLPTPNKKQSRYGNLFSK